MAYTFDIYQARDGWRWKMIAANGEIVADGSEAYATKANALRAVAALQTEMPGEGKDKPVAATYIDPADVTSDDAVRDNFVMLPESHQDASESEPHYLGEG